METLRPSYPYSPIDMKRKPDPNLLVGCSFAPFFPRSKQRKGRHRQNVNCDNHNNAHNYIADDIKNPLCHIRILLNNTRKKYLLKNFV